MTKTLSYLCFFFILCMSSFSASAQLLLEENFNYTSGAPLVAGAVASSDNGATSTTGWLTMSNSASGTNCFNISADGLTYVNYAGSGIGKAIDMLDNDGQDVFKTFSASNANPTAGAPFPGPKTIYIAFLINVPTGDKSGAEFFAGIKYSNNATDANYMGRIFAKVTGANVQFGISKSSTPSTTWTGDYPVGKTHLLVLKYTMGGLNGATSTEETNKYDDKVDLYVNPAIGTAEPASATLHYQNSADKDAYRYSSSNSIIGGLAALYFRTPATGAIPASTIDGIRVGDTWAKVVTAGPTNTAPFLSDKGVKVYMDQSHKQMVVNIDNQVYNQYQIYSITGSKLSENKIKQNDFTINMNAMKSGVYLVRFVGSASTYSSKIVVE